MRFYRQFREKNEEKYPSLPRENRDNPFSSALVAYFNHLRFSSALFQPIILSYFFLSDGIELKRQGKIVRNELLLVDFTG